MLNPVLAPVAAYRLAIKLILTSLNSWICDWSNIEKTLEVALCDLCLVPSFFLVLRLACTIAYGSLIMLCTFINPYILFLKTFEQPLRMDLRFYHAKQYFRSACNCAKLNHSTYHDDYKLILLHYSKKLNRHPVSRLSMALLLSVYQWDW